MGSPSEPSMAATDPPAAPPKPETPSMCFACGQMLEPQHAKCPSCGAPIRGRTTPRRRTNRQTVAGFLFVSLALVFIVQGLVLVTTASDLLPDAETDVLGRSLVLTGSVVDTDGNGIPGVNVTVLGVQNQSADTDASGTFTIRELSPGVRRAVFHRDNHTTVELRLSLYQNQAVTVTLEPGNGTEVQQHSTFRATVNGIRAYGTLVLLLAGFAGVGAVACYRAKAYRWALWGSILSLLGFLAYLPAVLLSIVTIILVARSRKEFR